ncbi:ABC transporter ATP-binding protein [candidate division FCPU426 bacterium]|nr:ABC transporter ATP-binding protein [candidate division FCPU426 bacterium]
MNEPILEIRDIRKSFLIGPQTLSVLKGVSLSVAKGEVVAIMGPSGAGKTTLLNIAGGLMHPSAGSVKIASQELFLQNDETLSRSRNRHVGFVFQMHHLLPEFTAEENVMMPALIAGAARGPAAERGRLLLQQVGLAKRSQHRPGELSGGEQQRVAIARALMNEPEILLADEPTGDLDGKTAGDIHALFRELNRMYKQTIVVVTHNPELGKSADRIITLEDGLIVSEEEADGHAMPAMPSGRG